MRLSEHLGLSLQECIEGTSQRQYALWMEHLDGELERPSRTDYYLMQLTAEVRRLFSRNVQLQDFVLKRDRKPTSREEATAKSRSVWLGIAGDRVTFTESTVKPP